MKITQGTTWIALLITLSALATRDVFSNENAIYELMYGTQFQPATNAQLRQDTKRIYLAPDDHTDLFWSADLETYKASFLEMIDYYLDLADATSDEPEAFQSRWNCDGSYWMWIYEKNRTPEEFERLIERIRDGHITVPLQALSVLLGGAPVEAIIRGMYYPGKIERKYGLRFHLAYAMENHTLPFGLSSVFAGCGASYSWHGVCHCDTKLFGSKNRQRDIYWWQGADGRRLLLKWNSLLVNNEHMGGYAEARDPAAIVDFVDSDPEFIARYPYSVIGAFGKGWDDVKTLTDEFVTVAKQKTTDTRQVIVSNEVDFFEDFKSVYSDAIPTFSGSFGNEWDLYFAAIAELSARVKRATERLRGAEAMATLVALMDPSFLNGREEARDQAWMNFGLFWEHCVGMVGRAGQIVQQRLDWQRTLVEEIEEYIGRLQRDSISRLGRMIKNRSANPRFFVFNPLSWARSDYADLPVEATKPVHVVHVQTGEEVPHQFVYLNGKPYVRIWAENIPPVGYSIFEIRDGAGSRSFENAAVIQTNRIETNHYILTVAENGAITRWTDKRNGNREWVRIFDGRSINDLGPSEGRFEVESNGPVSASLVVYANDPLNHVTRITVFRGSDRIEIDNEIVENFVQENIDDVPTWHFGFNIDSPDVWHEEVGSIIRAKKIVDGGHYADSKGRCDWLTLNHFADIHNDTGGVTLSNADCYFMKLGNSTVDDIDTRTSQISVLVGGRVVNDLKGYLDQAGDDYFLQRFALRSHNQYNPVNSMRFALEHQNPLLTGFVDGSGDRYPADSYSLLTIDNPNVLLWSLKAAEDGIDRGLSARIWNVSPEQENFSISFPSYFVEGATYTTHIETPLAEATIVDNALSDSIHASRIDTYLLKISPKAQAQSFLWGDLNNDQSVDGLDSTLVLDYSVFRIDRFPGYLDIVYPDLPPAADLNMDRIVGPYDASLILQYDTRYIHAFPVDSDRDGFGPDEELISGPSMLDGPLGSLRVLSVKTELVPRNEGNPTSWNLTFDLDKTDQLQGFRLALNYDPDLLEVPDNPVRWNAPVNPKQWEYNTLIPGLFIVAGALSRPMDTGEPFSLTVKIASKHENLMNPVIHQVYIDHFLTEINDGMFPLNLNNVGTIQLIPNTRVKEWMLF